MIDKITGKVAYAVMSFGGFMGIGQDYYPLPWNVLNYNPALEGYEVNISAEQLKGAPKYSTHETWFWENQAQSIDDYWRSYNRRMRLARQHRQPGGISTGCFRLRS